MKQIKLTFLLTILLSMVGAKALAYDAMIDGIYYNFSGVEAIVTSNGRYQGDIVIPESIEYYGVTYSVTSIGYGAFYGCSRLTSVEIPNSVTSIGASAFQDCTGLTSVEIPNSVTSIGASAFQDCTGLTSIDIPNSVTIIGADAFSDTPWYNNQPDGLIYAGKVAYKYKGTMPANTSITIKEGTLGIGVVAFQDCTGLTSIDIPNSVTIIGPDAFQDCTGLTTIEIPNSVTSIENGTFYGCSRLTSVTIGNSVTSIGSYAFEHCRFLVDITCLATWPPSCGGYKVFYGVDKSVCTLKVPEASIKLYKVADGWKEFSIIEATGIRELRNKKIEGLKYYDLNGNQSSQPRKGLNIVRMSNGKTKKVLVK